MKFIKLIKIIIDKYQQASNPVKYAKKIGVNIKGRVHLYGKQIWSTEPWIITLGDNVYLTNGTRFITHDGGTLILRDKVPDLEITKPITIGNNVYVGVNTTFLPGVNIGNNVIIGACSVVTKDIRDNSVAAGNPARVIKTIDEYFEKVQAESLHLGHLKGKEKDIALRRYYKYDK
ncbi:MAG TPA: acyltransferase [Clostridiales bacterium]|nr:acyltransferase [Clostridiales bacterium]